MKISMSILAVLIIAVAWGCSSNSNPIAGYEPEITNAADDFQFQATAMSNVTFSRDYVWQITGDSATIDQSPSAPLTGTVTLEILDALGTTVYTHDLADDGVFGTIERSIAEPGDWTLRVRFTNTTGTVNFRVQMAS